MSEDEQNLRRIRSWDRYKAAKKAYLCHRDRLSEWGGALRSIGLGLMTEPGAATSESFRAIPDSNNLCIGLDEFKEAVAELKTAWQGAADHGFPVDPNDIKEIAQATPLAKSV